MTGAIDPFENDADAGVDAPQVSLSTARSSLTQFEGPEWETWPFNFIYQSYLLTQKPWRDALNSVDGVRPREKHVASIATRQVLDMMSPANFVWSNPKVIARTISEGGANLMRGAWNLAEDWQRAAWGLPPVGANDYLPGRDVAVTPGKVVYRSDLLELIQYSPQTDTVAPEPVLIVPAWLMKYYVLDLSPQNSLVNYLCGQGFSVFIVSWANPGRQDGDIGIANYLGAVEEALDVVGRILPDAQTHAIGYCLGGTLLAIKAAQMARDDDERLKTVTLFASQTDFEERGELQSFIGELEVSMLERLMLKTGYWDGKYIAEAYKILRAGEWVWPRHVDDYLMGSRQPMSDLDAWSVDTTRLPRKVQSEYLRSMVLENTLAQGQYDVAGRPVFLSDIAVPVFCVAAKEDYIAPWRSIFKLHQLVSSSMTFVLTAGGHVDGIINEPGLRGQTFQIALTPQTASNTAPDDWQKMTDLQDGSWWPVFAEWLRNQSGPVGRSPSMAGLKDGAEVIEEAPGTYVFQK